MIRNQGRVWCDWRLSHKGTLLFSISGRWSTHSLEITYTCVSETNNKHLHYSGVRKRWNTQAIEEMQHLASEST